jgi:hypothetical protein
MNLPSAAILECRFAVCSSTRSAARLWNLRSLEKNETFGVSYSTSVVKGGLNSKKFHPGEIPVYTMPPVVSIRSPERES